VPSARHLFDTASLASSALSASAELLVFIVLDVPFYVTVKCRKFLRIYSKVLRR